MKNNSVMKCCVCNNKKSGEFITIDNEKYHLCCIKQLKGNWNKLKGYAKKIISTDNELYGTDLLDKMQEMEKNYGNVEDNT